MFLKISSLFSSNCTNNSLTLYLSYSSSVDKAVLSSLIVYFPYFIVWSVKIYYPAADLVYITPSSDLAAASIFDKRITCSLSISSSSYFFYRAIYYFLSSNLIALRSIIRDVFSLVFFLISVLTRFSFLTALHLCYAIERSM